MEKRPNSNRLKNYDYTKNGYYFITICTHDRKPVLSHCKNGAVILSTIGKIVEDCWKKIPLHFPEIYLNNYVIMPDHIHGIIIIDRCESFDPGNKTGTEIQTGKGNKPERFNISSNASPLRKRDGTRSGSIGAIIQNFKSVSTRFFNKTNETRGIKLWQRNYYDNVIRNEDAMKNICQYIENNPIKWAMDKKH